MWQFIIYFVYSSKYIIHSHTGQPQLTAKDSADNMLRDITENWATAAWKIANYVLDGCGLTHAKADLQRFRNLGDEAGPLYALIYGPISNGRLANYRIATTQSYRLTKENANQVKEGDRQTYFQTNKRAKVRLPNWQYQKLQPPAQPKRSSSTCPCLTTWVAATWRAHLTQPWQIGWWVIVVPLLHPLCCSRWFTLLLVLIIQSSTRTLN